LQIKNFNPEGKVIWEIATYSWPWENTGLGR